MPSPLEPNPSQVFAFNLETDVPLLLLPVRLETRFRSNELLIRVYPDAVHTDSFDRRLTETEIQWGKHFWQQTWLACTNTDEERNAWAQLAKVFGPLRAAWIAKELTPRNPGDQPTDKKSLIKGPLPTDPPRLRKEQEPTFPALLPFDSKSPHTPCTELLPDYWVASVNISYVEDGQPTSRTFLERGPDVKNQDGSDRILVMPRLDRAVTPETLKDDPDAGWLVDFTKAKDKGMGLQIKLDEIKLAVNGAEFKIDQLLVYGVKASLGDQEGKTRLEKLLQAHHHTQGLAFVPQGTPTNNTMTASSAYSSGDPGSIESFQIERMQTASTNLLSNHSVMARALGIDPACLTNISEANAVEQQHARDMNDVLWEATWGYCLKDMLALKGTHDGKIEQMRLHFLEHVRARGPFPALRIGRQPYGVLPVLSLDPSSTDPAVQCLLALRKIWRASLSNVPKLVRPPAQDPDHALTLLKILAMAPTGISYVGRPCTRIVPMSSPTSSEGTENTGQRPLPAALQKALDAMLGPNMVTPHQRTVFASQSNVFSVTNPLVQKANAQGTSAVSLFDLLRDKNKDAADLATLPVADRELLLKETLDLCSHRLDAWVTSLATKRLDQLRQPPPKGKPKGISIGGYGWVENLQPDAKDRDSHGFIHAPSLAHATTAAVLRSGYDSRRLSQTPRDSNALAINLSSEPVRLALHLIDGVRGGQSLGTLLGYRFERGLHEKGLDRFIPAFRKLAPGSTELISTADPSDETKTKLKNLVLDGLALLDAYKNAKITADLLGECRSELIRLADAIDAVADLVLAESVHQVAQGNHVRAGATLEAIARGEAPPPELDFIRTPRTGINHTHRISLIFGGPPAAVPWGIATPRGQAEPVLNAWVAQMLGPQAEEAFCTVTYTDPNPDPTVKMEPQSRNITIKDLGLAPLDLVYLLDGEVGGQQSEIEQRILYHVLKDKPSITTISLEFTSSAGGIPPSLTEIVEVARTIRRVITGARVLEPRDLDLPENVAVDEESGADPSLIARASAARKAFVEATEALRATLPRKPEDLIVKPTAATAVRDALKNVAAYGLMGAIPVLPLAPNENSESVLKNLHAQALSVLDEATLRQKRAQASPAPIRNNAQAIAVLHELFGQDFSALPAFTPLNGNELNQTFGKSVALQGGKPQESVTWFQRMARVRDGAARLDAAMLYAEALNGPMLSFQVGQLPSRDGEQWLALKNPPQGNRLSLVCLTAGSIDFTKPVAGLLVDEWVEMVPNKDEVTGLAFHFDAPQPRAPQALLLAMAPEGVDKWDSVTLENTLCETLELAKLRAVDLTALGEVGQYLPAMYFKHVGDKSPFA